MFNAQSYKDLLPHVSGADRKQENTKIDFEPGLEFPGQSSADQDKQEKRPTNASVRDLHSLCSFIIKKTVKSCDFCDIQQGTRGAAEGARRCAAQSSSDTHANNAPGLWRGCAGIASGSLINQDHCKCQKQG